MRIWPLTWLVGCIATSAFALDRPRVPGLLRDFGGSEREMTSGARASGPAFQAARSLDVDDAVRAHVAARVSLTQLEMRAEPTVEFGGTRSHSFRFRFRGLPLCTGMLRAHERADGSLLIFGRAPDLAEGAAVPGRELPDASRAKDLAVRWATEELGAKVVTSRVRSACYAAADRRLHGAWRIEIEADGMPYRLFVDEDRIHAVEERFFSADGQARVFPSNRLSGEAELAPLTGLVGNGTLTSTYLKTLVPNGWPSAVGVGEVFDFAPDALEFDEVQAFYHGSTHLAFAETIGFGLRGIEGRLPIQVRLHTPPNGLKNNALYLEGDEDSHPRVIIDDGDGLGLRNLASDRDVISHELGHHLIFKTLKRKTGEGLVLHEGLADFLVFARTGDGCLGESICPAGSASCQVAGQCLRSAAVAVAFDDDTWKEWARRRNGSLGHLHSQLISGMLWGLRERGEIAADELTHTVARSIGLLAEQSGIREFLLSLFAADEELFGKKNFARIYAAAIQRNLGSFLDGVEPPPPEDLVTAPPLSPVDVPDTTVAATPVSAPATPTLEDAAPAVAPEILPPAGVTPVPELRAPGVPSDHEEETYRRKCGVVGLEAVAQPGSLFGLAMLLFAPVLIVLKRRK